MKSYWTPRALSAVAGIYEYIARDNVTAANNLRDKIIGFVEETLATQPLIGRPGRVAGTREGIVHASYIIVYRVHNQQVEIITVRHVAQQWPRKF
jgi:toxin ParE1/3/4